MQDFPVSVEGQTHMLFIWVCATKCPFLDTHDASSSSDTGANAARNAVSDADMHEVDKSTRKVRRRYFTF